jgi:predicted nuclease with TOPRIM domain
MAPILSAGIVGGTLLLLILLRNLKPQRGEAQKADPVEPNPPLEEKAVEQIEPFINPKEEEVFIPRETLPSEIIELQQGPSDPVEAKGRLEEDAHGQKESLEDPQVLPENGKWTEIRERILSLEEKTINLEDMLMQLEEKVAGIQENHLKSEPKIDLQTLLTKIEERAEKIA